MRIRTKSCLMCSIIVVLCVTLLTGGTLSQSVKGTKISDKTHTNEDIVELYQELIKLRQRVLDEIKLKIGYGAGVGELIDARTKATEARIQLAQFHGKKETVIEELQSLVQFYTEMRKSLIVEVNAGQGSRMVIYEIDIRLLETKIWLAMAKQEKE